MKKQLLPGDVITPAPGCDWFEPPHPLFIIVSATPFPGDRTLSWWQVKTTPPLPGWERVWGLSSSQPPGIPFSHRPALYRRGLILFNEWTVVGH